MRQSPNGRPLVGQRLNDTVTLVQRGIKPPPARYEMHYGPSAEAMTTPIAEGGTRPDYDPQGRRPDSGHTMSRVRDYLRAHK